MKTMYRTKLLIALLSVLLVFTMIPMSGVMAYAADDSSSAAPAQAATAGGLTSVGGVPQIIAPEDHAAVIRDSNDSADDLLNPKAPAGFNSADDSNPFGYDKGVAFRLYEDAEVFTYATDPALSIKPVADIHEQYKKDDGSAFLNNDSWDKTVDLGLDGEQTYSAGDINKHFFVYSTPLDIGCCDSPRKTCMAFIGAKKNGDAMDVDVWVYDTQSKKYSNVLKIGQIADVKDNQRDETETFLYQMKNFLSITAGDYDNDNKDSIVAYGAFSDGPSLTEIKVDGDGSSAPVLSKVSDSNKMLHEKYLDSFADFKDDHSIDLHRKLGCSLESGDVTGDKTDDLIAVSYTQVLTDGAAQKYGDEIMLPYLAVSKGGSSLGNIVSGDSDMTTYVGTETADSKDAANCTERITIANPTALVADTVITDGDGVAIGGYSKTILRLKDTKEIYEVPTFRAKAGVMIYDCTGDSLKLGKSDTMPVPDALKKGIARRETTLPKLPVAAVSIDGTANKDRIFAGGTFWEITRTDPKSVYTVPAFDHEYSAGDFGADGQEFTELYVDNLAVASLSKIGGNYESVAFDLIALTRDTSGTYLNTPYTYHYKVGAAGPKVAPETSRVTGYYGTNADSLDGIHDRYMQENILTSAQFSFLNQGDPAVSFIMCPVDYVDDGLTVRYNDKKFVYADPRVLAVLQASPYFDELGEAGGTTEYNFSNEYSYTDEDSHTKSYGVGIAAQLTTPYVEASVRVGYSGETRTWTEKEFTTEHTVSFEADHDSVVVYRTPIIYYMYDVYKPDTDSWEEQGLDISYVRPGEYKQLSVDEYNSFAAEYNKEGKERYQQKKLDPNDFTELKLLGNDTYLGCEGSPGKYYADNMDPPAGYGVIDDHTHTLGYNGGSDATELVTGSSVTTGKEQNDGVSVEFDVLGGPEVFKAGVYGSFEEMWGHSTSDTNSESTGVRTSVNNLDEGELLSKGFTDEQIRAHAFSWLPAKWDSGLEYTYKSKDGKLSFTRTVPMYGYSLSNVSAPYNLSEAAVTLDPASFEYDGKEKAPSVKVELDGKTLAEKEYTVSYECDGKAVDKCVEPGTYLVVVKGAGSNIGEKSEPFTIVDTRKIDLADAEMTLDHDQFQYNEKAQAPKVTLKYKDKILEQGKDYDLEYAEYGGFIEECVAPGTYTVIAEGKDKYTGSAAALFTIIGPEEPIDIQDAKVDLSKTAYKYDGNVHKPSIVTIDGRHLTSGIDYVDEWSDPEPVKAGTYTVKITGKGGYTGQTKASFKINKAANPMKVKGKTAQIKRTELILRSQTVAGSKVVAVRGAEGKVTYTKLSGNKAITINSKTGAATIKRGLKKGTYKVSIKVNAAGNSNYDKTFKTATFTVKVI